MVMRKPLAPDAATIAEADKSDFPYPATPTADAPPATTEGSSRRSSPYIPSAVTDRQSAWRSEQVATDGLPVSLRSGGGRQSMEGSHSGVEDIPESLRVGRPGYTPSPRSSSEMQRPTAESTNPYIQRQQTSMSGTSDGRESSANAWGGFAERPPIPSGAPPPPPVPKGKLRSLRAAPLYWTVLAIIVAHGQDKLTIWGLYGMIMLYHKLNPFLADTPPHEEFANMSFSEQNTNPWQKSLDTKPLPQQPDVATIERQDSGEETWPTVSAPAPHSRTATGTTQPPVLVTMPTEESPAWDEDEPPSQSNLTPSSDLEVVQREHEEENAWQENVGESQQNQTRMDLVTVAQDQYLQGDGGWESGLQAQESGIIEIAPMLPARPPTEERPPGLPPRPSQEVAKSPVVGTEDITPSATSSGAAARRQKKETYEIKRVSWYDATASSNPRISPILVQNANGPCPLLALVNALTLSTPAEVNTALVDTLRSREQVSLGLLLDAVFDELMSGRRGDAAQELPDVGDLYAFLITLHTGMNVNPRFFPPDPTNSVDDPRRSVSHVHPMEREEVLPGTFEETREMKLYSTFSVPLIHGWLPERDSPAYAALARSARSYEDGQHLMFREEELEDKLQREGLSIEEQSALEDISTIKAFFNESATQLTPYGLETITKSIAPGSVAILFRNDHFSTLYKHPGSHQLLQLVTDMGYAGHEEVVWESLVDVNGENCEFFSGDFRLVGGALSEARQSVDASEWTTVPSRGNRSTNNLQVRNSTNTQSDEAVAVALMPTNTEQEDHDLALALQLQDEEEQRHQEEIARRRHEAELSQQYIEQQGSQQVDTRVPVTARGGGRAGRNQGRNRGPSRGASELRPTIPPRRNNTSPPGPVADLEAGADVPPPSYEQAATQEAYIPPVNHPAHPSASTERLSRRQSAYSANSAAYANNQATPRLTRGGRVNSSGSRAGALINEVQNARRPGLTQQQQDDRSKDCILM